MVEVAVKPGIRDIGGLLALAEMYEALEGVRPVPALVAVYVEDEVGEYAREKGVRVYKV